MAFLPRDQQHDWNIFRNILSEQIEALRQSSGDFGETVARNLGISIHTQYMAYKGTLRHAINRGSSDDELDTLCTLWGTQKGHRSVRAMVDDLEESLKNVEKANLLIRIMREAFPKKEAPPKPGNGKYTITINNYNTLVYFGHQQLTPSVYNLMSNRSTPQLEYLQQLGDKDFNNQILGYNIGKPEQILKLSDVLTSICTVFTPNGSGTGFLAEVKDKGICFLSAGHNFKSVLDCTPENTDAELRKYKVIFGNIDGNPAEEEVSTELKQLNTMSLKAFLDEFQFYGSISCPERCIVQREVDGGIQKVFKEGHGALPKLRVHDELDYCAFLLNGTSLDEVKDKLKSMQIGYLQCGYDQYLACDPDAPVQIAGHPGVANAVPMRLSYGKETKMVEKKDNGRLINRLYSTYDSLKGNSGSPVIGSGREQPYRVGSEQAYKVKAIHIEGWEWGETKTDTCGQSIVGIKQWIDLGKS